MMFLRISEVPPSIRPRRRYRVPGVTAVEIGRVRPAHRPVPVALTVSSGQLDLEPGNLLVEPREDQLATRTFETGWPAASCWRSRTPRSLATSAAAHSRSSVSQAGRAQLGLPPGPPSGHHAALPGIWTPLLMDTRSFISVPVATFQPSPTAPIRSIGIVASVRKTSLNSASPVSWRNGLTDTPGAVMSREK